MKTFIFYLAKKYIIGTINKVLKEKKSDVQHITQTVEIWIGRLEKMTTQLKNINSRISDGQITKDELDESLQEIETLVKEF